MSDAALKKSSEPARSALQTGARVLLRAVEAGDAAEVRRLVAAGAAADVPLAGGETMLMRAAAKGHADVARVLLDGGAEVNARRMDGFTPLIIATFYGHAEVVRLLLERGADTTTRTRLGSAADEWAASHGFAEIAELLKRAASTGVKAFAPIEGIAVDHVPRSTQSSLRDDIDETQSTARRSESEPPQHEVKLTPPAPTHGARYRRALPVALSIVAISSIALYAFVWRAKSPPRNQAPPSSTSGAANVTALPVPQVDESAPNAQPTPTVVPPEIQGAQDTSNLPVITITSDAPPVAPNPAAGQSTLPPTSAPSVVSEEGAQASDGRTPRRGAANPTGEQSANAADGSENDEQDRNARSENDPARQTQGQGAEIRTGAPARPSSPSSTLLTQPSPAPSPKKKVIQWP